MPTKPPTDLFDRDISKALVREKIDLASPLIQEVVNYGVAAFLRCLTTGKPRDEKLAILMPYFHLLEMVDGIEILLAQAAPFPAQLQLRSAFEALLTIEYIVETDTVRRAYAYLVAGIHRRLASYYAMDPNTREGKHRKERITADKYVGDVRIPDIPGIEAGIANLEGILQKPGWREADVEYGELKKRLGRRPSWYQLYGGPQNLERLATHVGGPACYDILYREWSEMTHVEGSIYQLFMTGEEVEPVMRRVRDPSEFDTVVALAVTFALRATRLILGFFRAEELPAFGSWYVREVRETFLRFLGPGSQEDAIL